MNSNPKGSTMTEKFHIILNDDDGLADEVAATTEELRRVFDALRPVLERALDLDARVSIAQEKWVHSLPLHWLDDTVTYQAHDVFSTLAYYELGGQAMRDLLHGMADAMNPERACETATWVEWITTGRDEWRASSEAVTR